MAVGFFQRLLRKFFPQRATPAREDGGNGRGRRGRRGRNGSNRQPSGGNGQGQQQGQKQRQQQQPKNANQQQKQRQPQQQQNRGQQQGQKQRQPQQPKNANQQQKQRQQQQQQNRGQQQKLRQTKPQPSSLSQEAVILPAPPVGVVSPIAAPYVAPPVMPEPVVPAAPVPAVCEEASPAAETAASEKVFVYESVPHLVYEVASADRLALVQGLLAQGLGARVVVFCRQQATAEEVQRGLEARGVGCGLLTGVVAAGERASILEAFRGGTSGVVVATEGFVASLLAESLDVIVNYDFPYEAGDYVGRALAGVRLVSFADEDDLFAIPEIEKQLGVTVKCARYVAGASSAAPTDSVPPVEVEPEPPPPPPMPKTGIPVFDAEGREGRVAFDENAPLRPLPTFEKALDVQPPVDETDAYLKPVTQTERMQEWVPEANA